MARITLKSALLVLTSVVVIGVVNAAEAQQRYYDERYDRRSERRPDYRDNGYRGDYRPERRREVSTVCRFHSGPRRGTSFDYAAFGMAPIPVGGPCNDGVASQGVVVSNRRYR